MERKIRDRENRSLAHCACSHMINKFPTRKRISERDIGNAISAAVDPTTGIQILSFFFDLFTPFSNTTVTVDDEL